MTNPVDARAAADEAMEVAMGHLLRAGVVLSGLIVLAGATVYLSRHHAMRIAYNVFTSEPEDLRSIRGILAGIGRGQGRSIIQFGILMLVATPIARVVFSAISFVRERDWLYVALTATVLSLLLVSLFSG